jgi:hypothetical protein
MPKSRKKAKAVTSATGLTTLGAALEQLPVAATIAAHEAKAQEPEGSMPGPDDAAQAEAAFRRQRERDQAVSEPPRSHAQQLGPRKRTANEPGSVYTGKDFKLLKDADRWYFEFEQEPTEDRLRVLKQLDFRPSRDPKTLKSNPTSWQSNDWAKATAHAQSAAIWMDGKDISHGRGA